MLRGGAMLADHHRLVGWSPQQIAGRLKLDGRSQGRVSHETIYRHIYSKGGREDALFGLLPMARR
jgi:transposase, IS30 family